MAILKDLIVHGSSRFLNKIYASEIQTSLIEAEAGIFKKLKADDATVVGLLDVKGQLHTNSWSNSNLATIDGSFYITPTIGSASGTVTVTASSLVFSGTNYAVSSLYLGDGSSITWPQYSKVLVTGQILSNGEWIPLGTLLGQLSSTATAASISINNIKDNKNQTSNVLATLMSNGTTSSSYRNLKVSLYQRASSSTAFYPLGIYMTATGTNGRTFLDIYGGVEALSNSNNYGGFAEPNVRIGNLQGLPNVGGQSPNGWGIYTDNGYFKGIIAADQGYIGSGSKYWVIANEEDLSNSENSRSYIYNGTNNIASTVEGVYLGTDGIRNYKDSTHNVTIKDGVITALGVNLSGKIIATSGTIGGASITNGTLIVGNANINDINASKINAGDIAAARIQTNLISAINAKVSDLSTLTATIGGFQIDSSSIHTKSVAITSNADNSIALSSADFTRTINSTSRTGLRFAIGDKFGITGDGTIYASNVDLTGKITATSGTIGGIDIIDGALDVSSISIGNLKGAKDLSSSNLLKDVYASSLTKENASSDRYFSDVSNSTITGQFIAEDNLPDPNATHFVRLTDSSASTKGRGLCFYSTDTPPFINGHTYRIGCWVRKHAGSPKMNITLGSYGSWMPAQRIIDNTDWEWVEVVHTFGDTDPNVTTQSDTYKRLYFYFYNNNVAGSSLDMCGFKMEEIPVNSGTARNFLLGTEKLTNWGTNNGTTISDGIATFPSVSSNTWREIYPAKNFKYDLIRNQYAIFSVKVKAEVGEKCLTNLCIGINTTETAYIRKKWMNLYIYFTGTGEWQTICSAIPIFDYMFNSGSGTVDFNDCWVTVRIGATNTYHNGFQAKEPQLCLGTNATSWSRAPEDYVEEIDDARTTATNYITQIDNTGIKITPYDKSGNDYLQINSDAISMYRANAETLRIEDDSIRVGNVNYQNLLLEPNQVLIKKGDKESLKIKADEFSYFFKSGISPFHIKQLGHIETQTGNGTKKQFTSNSSYFVAQLLGVTINNVEQEENDNYTYSIQNGVCTVTFTSAPANNSTINFNYDIEYEIGQLLKTASDTESSARTYIDLPQTCMEVLHVYVNNTETSAWHYPSFSVQGEIITIYDYIRLDSDPGQGANIKVIYKTQPEGGFYMTLGTRATGSNDPGPYSIVIGEKNFATGQGAFAAGRNVNVSGEYSFAYGDGGNSDMDSVDVDADYACAIGKGLRVSRVGGFACGRYNTWSNSYTWAFQVGNGTGPMDRSDAFGVAENGNIYITGKLLSGVVGKNPHYLFTTEDFEVDNISVPATGGSVAAISETKIVNIAIDGYIAIGLMSFVSQTATNEGLNASCVFPYAWWLNQNYFRFSLRNTVASPAKCKIRFRILYIAADAINTSLFPSSGNV